MQQELVGRFSGTRLVPQKWRLIISVNNPSISDKLVYSTSNVPPDLVLTKKQLKLYTLYFVRIPKFLLSLIILKKFFDFEPKIILKLFLSETRCKFV